MTITTEQKVIRQAGIGGSDASCIMNMNPWKSSYELFKEKRGEAVSKPGNEMMWIGSMLEDQIGQMYSVKTGRPVRTEPDTLFHPEHDFILGHVDFISDGFETRGVEIKNVGHFSAGAWKDGLGEDMIPDYYLTQVVHYSLLTGINIWDFAVLIGGQELKIMTVNIGEDAKRTVLESEIDFWRRIQENDPPENIKEIDLEMANRLFPKDNGQTVVCSKDIQLTINRLKDYKANKKVCEELISPVEIQIKEFMGEYSLIEDEAGKPLCTWKKRKDRNVTDWEGAFKELKDDFIKTSAGDKCVKAIIQKHTTSKPGSRTFLVK